MPPRLLGFVRSKIITFFYLALIIPCLLAPTNQTFAQETPVQPAATPSTPLIHIVRKTDDLSAQSKPKQQTPAAHLNYYRWPRRIQSAGSCGFLGTQRKFDGHKSNWRFLPGYN